MRGLSSGRIGDTPGELDELTAGVVVKERGLVGHQDDLLLDVERAFGHGQAGEFDDAGRRWSQATIGILMGRIWFCQHSHWVRGSRRTACGTVRVGLDGGFVTVHFSQVADFDRRSLAAMCNLYGASVRRGGKTL